MLRLRVVAGCVVCGVGESGRAAVGRLQVAGSRQHGMGICDGGTAGYDAFYIIGEGG